MRVRDDESEIDDEERSGRRGRKFVMTSQARRMIRSQLVSPAAREQYANDFDEKHDESKTNYTEEFIQLKNLFGQLAASQ